MNADRERWDARWTEADHPVEPAPPDALADRPALVDLLPTEGTAVDLACGLGAQALWLAERGLAVTALDVSPVAIGRLNTAAQQNVPRSESAGQRHLDARVWDTDDGLPFELTGLAVLVCQRYRSPALYPEFVQRLRIGGVLVLTVLSAVGLDGSPGAFHAPAGELRMAFDRRDVDVALHTEGHGQASIVLRRTS